MTRVDEMDLEEISRRLLDAFRNGRLNMDLKGFVLGFAKSMKRHNPRCPSQKQISMARRLVGEIRQMDGTEPVSLLDTEDEG
jgi:hypothetical protein